MERLFAEIAAAWLEEHGKLGLRFWAPVVWDVVREAGREWGAVATGAVRQDTRRSWGEIMGSIVTDVRLALRQLARQPLYAVTILVLMAVGVAGNAAVFRVFNGLFLRPLPFDEPELLVDLDETAPEWNLEFLNIAYRDFDTWRAENRTFESMAVMDRAGGNFISDGAPRRVDYLSTTHDLDDVLRLEPQLGRFYTAEEDNPDGPRVGLLSHSFWRQEFGSDPEVVGRVVSLNGVQIEIIGVLPTQASFLTEVDLWIPLRQTRSDFSGWGLSGIGRLNPGVSIEQAEADLLSIHKAAIEEFPVNEVSSPVVHSLRDRFLGDYRLGTGFMLGAVGIVLLIACANIAGLMFVRSISRSGEMAVRLALGAPRRRLVQQLLTESLVLALLGAGLGAALGIWGSGALVAPMADQFPSWVTFDLDGRFLGFTVLITLTATLVFGLAPAVQASRDGLALRATGRSTASRKQRRWMSLLVTSEVALALALLVVGGLSVLDVRALGQVDPGFDADGLISYSVTLPRARYEDDVARLGFADQYLERLQAIPGVEAAAVTSSMPLDGHWGWLFMVDGAPPRAEEEANPVVLNRVVSPGYFATAGVEFVAGRPFDDFDGREDGTGAIIVNESFVRTHLSHLDNPIGAQVTPGTEIEDDSEWWTVVGVTRDVMHYGVDEEMRPGVYQPLRQLPLGGFTVALRTQGDPAPIVSQARAITTELDLELPVYDVAAMNETLAESLWTRRAMSWLIGAFSTIALLLAVAGIYGLISYSVGQRTQEISIRMAMGAQRTDVLAQVLRQGLSLVAVGVVIGLAVSFAGADLVSGLLVDVPATEPLVYVGVTALLVGVAAVANYLPARRAASIDPMRTLRGD